MYTNLPIALGGDEMNVMVKIDALAMVALLDQPTLLKVQAPITTISNWIDSLLQHAFPVRPALVWTLHVVLALVMTLLGTSLAGWICGQIGRMAERRHKKLAASLFRLAAPTLRWMVLLSGLSDVVEDAWPAIKGPMHWLSGGLYVLSAIVATRGAVGLMRLTLDSLLRPSIDGPSLPQGGQDGGLGRHPSAGQPASPHALLPLIQRLAALLIWLIGLILVLDHFGQNVSSVVAAFGVTSLAIGLAAQQALSNIIAGLVLAVDHPFRPGDRIRLPNGDGGEVVETGMRATHIRVADGSLLIVPNADLVSSRLVNQSTETLVRAEVRVNAPATMDVDRLSAQLLEEAALMTDPDSPPRPPRVQLLSVGERVELALILWLPRFADVPSVEEKLRRAALKRLQALLAAPTPVAAPAVAAPTATAPAAPSPSPQNNGAPSPTAPNTPALRS